MYLIVWMFGCFNCSPFREVEGGLVVERSLWAGIGGADAQRLRDGGCHLINGDGNAHLLWHDACAHEEERKTQV